MAELIAQGVLPQHRWRRKLPVGNAVLGRSSGIWSTEWDERISRRHVLIEPRGKGLVVSLLPEARNPVFYRGEKNARFELQVGEHFVIGGTTFTLVDEKVRFVAHDRDSSPVTELTFAAEELRQAPYRHADKQIEALSRLPEIVASSASDTELLVRLASLLLGGASSGDTVAIVMIDPAAPLAQPTVLHWDHRALVAGEFTPSSRLIRQAVSTKQSVLYLWGADPSASAIAATATANPASSATADGANQWAYCCPITSPACPGWAIYVCGKLEALPTSDVDYADAIRDELKFTELAAATIGGLREAQLLGRKQAMLRQFFSPPVLDALAADPTDQVLSPRETEVTVLFCDLRGFSLESERYAGRLTQLLERVSQALGVMTHHILEQGGVVGDFHGDSAMGFWGWPLSQSDAPLRAARAALMIRDSFSAAAANSSPLADFRVGIGLATGTAVAGKIGSIDQVKVTVFGPVVNLASRLEGMTKTVRVPILLDQPTADALRAATPTDMRLRRLAKVRPAGLSTPLEITELLPSEAIYPQLNSTHIGAFESAVDAFAERDWNRALAHLHEVPPDDLAKDFLTVFIAQHGRVPPPGWDGVIPILEK